VEAAMAAWDIGFESIFELAAGRRGRAQGQRKAQGRKG
tara:strand:+ start:221 stop:334 length:114 start_codon:yes stop_codon:yes gene_type:complete